MFDDKSSVFLLLGEGKSKTSAAMGMALRALGSDWSVFLGQFLKNENSWPYGEIKTFKQLGSDNLTIKQFGCETITAGCNWSQAEIISTQAGWQECKKIILGKDVTFPPYKMVILDELNVAIGLGFIDVDDVIQTILDRPSYMNIVLTGRGHHQKLIDICDLVTEMKEVKHYYRKGVKAKAGIEW